MILYPENLEDFKRGIELCKEMELPRRIIGATSNLLFLDECLCTVLISTTRLTRLEVGENEIRADAGVMLGDLSRIALLHGITGYEGLEGIPGTVGGAVFMNAGAYGSEISKILVTVTLYRQSSGELQTFSCEDMEFAFRYSRLMNDRDLVVLSAVFKKNYGVKSKIYEKMELYHAKRHRYNEFCYPNLGSLFVDNIVRLLLRKKLRARVLIIFYSRLMRTVRFVTRQSPINQKFVIGVLSKEYDLATYSDTYSAKGLNCLTNSGQGTAKMCDYIDLIKRLCGQKIRMENEIIDGDPTM